MERARCRGREQASPEARLTEGNFGWVACVILGQGLEEYSRVIQGRCREEALHPGGPHRCVLLQGWDQAPSFHLSGSGVTER